MGSGFSEIGNNWAAVAFNQIAPRDDAGRPQTNKVFSESDKKLIVNGILNACDANDGLKDGMVFNTRACKFDPEVLACSGAKTDASLTTQQVGAPKKAFPGPRNSKSHLVYPLTSSNPPITNQPPSSHPPT